MAIVTTDVVAVVIVAVGVDGAGTVQTGVDVDVGVDVVVIVVVEVGATRSQEGHIVRVVAGRCMKKGWEVFKALNS